jgi:hypothetical protein
MRKMTIEVDRLWPNVRACACRLRVRSCAFAFQIQGVQVGHQLIRHSIAFLAFLHPPHILQQLRINRTSYFVSIVLHTQAIASNCEARLNHIPVETKQHVGTR